MTYDQQKTPILQPDLDSDNDLEFNQLSITRLKNRWKLM